MSSNMLVLDANILIRAVLGNRVKKILLDSHHIVDFFIPDVCIADAKKYLPILFKKRSASPELGLQILSDLQCLLQVIDKSIYQEHIIEAQQRIRNRDLDDWPIVATALTFNCSIWTEDQDFFGTGIPIWTTDRIHIFLSHCSSALEKI